MKCMKCNIIFVSLNQFILWLYKPPFPGVDKLVLSYGLRESADGALGKTWNHIFKEWGRGVDHYWTYWQCRAFNAFKSKQKQSIKPTSLSPSKLVKSCVFHVELPAKLQVDNACVNHFTKELLEWSCNASHTFGIVYHSAFDRLVVKCSPQMEWKCSVLVQVCVSLVFNVQTT